MFKNNKSQLLGKVNGTLYGLKSALFFATAVNHDILNLE